MEDAVLVLASAKLGGEAARAGGARMIDWTRVKFSKKNRSKSEP